MAANDLGIWRHTTGGRSIPGGGADVVLSLDSADTIIEESAYVLEPTSGSYVEAQEDHVALAIWGSRFTGSGLRTVRHRLMRDAGSGPVEVSRVYGCFSNQSGLDEGPSFGVCLFPIATDDRLSMHAREQRSVSAPTEMANSTFLALWRLPATIDVCCLSNSLQQSLSTSFADLEFDTEEQVDAGSFTVNQSGTETGIEVAATDRYLVGYIVPIRLNSDPKGAPTGGCTFRVHLTINGTEETYSRMRRGTMPLIAGGSDEAMCVLLPLSLTAGDEVKVQALYDSLGDLTDTGTVLGDGVARFFAARVGTAADFFQLDLSADIGSINGTATDVPWDQQVELDTGSFDHATATDNERVTLPTDKVLTFCKLGAAWPSPGSPSVGFDCQFYEGTTTPTAYTYGDGGTGVNGGDAGGGPNQNQTDMACGLLLDATGEVLRVTVEEIGTGADANFELIGGTAFPPNSSTWWGLNIGQLAGDAVVVQAGDAWDLTDDTLQFRALKREAADGWDLTDELLRLRTLLRQGDDVWDQTDVFLRLRTLLRQADDDWEHTDALAYYLGSVLRLSDDLEFTDVLSSVSERSVFVQGNPTGRVAIGGGLLGNVATEQQ